MCAKHIFVFGETIKDLNIKVLSVEESTRKCTKKARICVQAMGLSQCSTLKFKNKKGALLKPPSQEETLSGVIGGKRP